MTIEKILMESGNSWESSDELFFRIKPILENKFPEQEYIYRATYLDFASDTSSNLLEKNILKNSTDRYKKDSKEGFNQDFELPYQTNEWFFATDTIDYIKQHLENLVIDPKVLFIMAYDITKVKLINFQIYTFKDKKEALKGLIRVDYED